jgi:hypothetical protein
MKLFGIYMLELFLLFLDCFVITFLAMTEKGNMHFMRAWLVWVFFWITALTSSICNGGGGRMCFA